MPAFGSEIVNFKMGTAQKKAEKNIDNNNKIIYNIIKYNI